MVFAAQKLRMTPQLKNPTVVIVLDRLDLETQITGTFNASDISNMAALATKDELLRFFRQDMRGELCGVALSIPAFLCLDPTKICSAGHAQDCNHYDIQI